MRVLSQRRRLWSKTAALRPVAAQRWWSVTAPSDELTQQTRTCSSMSFNLPSKQSSDLLSLCCPAFVMFLCGFLRLMMWSSSAGSVTGGQSERPESGARPGGAVRGKRRRTKMRNTQQTASLVGFDLLWSAVQMLWTWFRVVVEVKTSDFNWRVYAPLRVKDWGFLFMRGHQSELFSPLYICFTLQMFRSFYIWPFQSPWCKQRQKLNWCWRLLFMWTIFRPEAKTCLSHLLFFFPSLQKLKEKNLDEWRNIRGPRPWEDSRQYQDEQRSRQNKDWAPESPSGPHRTHAATRIRRGGLGCSAVTSLLSWTWGPEGRAGLEAAAPLLLSAPAAVPYNHQQGAQPAPASYGRASIPNIHVPINDVPDPNFCF